MKAQGFDRDPVLRHPIGSSIAYMAADLTYVDAKGRPHTAPTGMPTDGGSIPRFFWRVIGPPMASVYLPAAIIHDHICYLVDHMATFDVDSAKQLRLTGDKLFYEMLLFLGVNKAKAWTMYKGVRIGAQGIK